MKTISAFSAFSLILLLATSCEPQPQDTHERAHYETPDLVIGIIVDQLRPDYVYRYWDHFGDDGFKRLVNNGYTFRNTYFRHMPTSTGPGHAAQYSGATPSVHGLVGNSWYVRELDRNINVIEDVDSGWEGIGSEPDYPGEKSPGNMLTTTFGDELYLHTNERSKTVGISRKDRGAILPAGHTGQAYWYEFASGNFITSTYYRDELPGWLQEFNDRNLPQEFAQQPWETLLPIEDYVESMADDNPYEGMFGGEDSPTFPHGLPTLIEDHGQDHGIVMGTPFGDEILIELAFAALEGEELGRGEVTDILAIGLSAMDSIGHRFGPASKEVQDGVIRLDRQLARLFNYIDVEYGRDNVLVFLTADHGVVHIPHYLRDLGIPTGHPDAETPIAGPMIDELRDHLSATYGSDFLLAYSNWNLFLDHDFMDQNNLDHARVRKDVKRFMLSLDPVAGAVTADALNSSEFSRGIRSHAQHGYHQKRSGDVVVWLEPQTTGGSGTGGTTHGSPWVYDTHVPLHFYGFGVPSGQSTERVYVSDIASTVATFMNSPFPSGNIGNPLNDRMK